MPLLTSLLTLLLLQPPAPASAPPLTLPVPATPAPTGQWSDTLKGKWQGTIELPPPSGGSLGFILTITGADAALIAIPQQGVAEAPLSDVAINTATMKFSLPLPNTPPGSSPVWELTTTDADNARGTLRQSGMTLTTTLKRLAEGDDGGPKRPQTPKPPFPYTTREVSYGSFDTAAMNGTLTIPEEARFGKGPFACVLFITGSGMQDRDETLFSHKPFAVLADALARAGVASLRVDDRGYKGAKDPLNGDGTTETFARDTAAGVDFLATQPDIDPSRIGLLGHSEGGLIAPAVAVAKPAGNGGVGFVVLLAAPGVPGSEVLTVQLTAILKSQGATQEQIASAAAVQKATLAAVAAGDEAAVRKLMLDAVKENDPTGALAGKTLDDAVEAGMKQVYSPWMRHFLTRDPRTDLRKVRCPVLILNGGKDVQVLASQNVPQVTQALLDGDGNDGGNTCITARVFPNCNHLFQPVGTSGGGLAGYNQIETTMDHAVMEEIVRWIAEIARVQTAK